MLDGSDNFKAKNECFLKDWQPRAVGSEQQRFTPYLGFVEIHMQVEG